VAINLIATIAYCVGLSWLWSFVSLKLPSLINAFSKVFIAGATGRLQY
jgi:hypothetical protein